MASTEDRLEPMDVLGSRVAMPQTVVHRDFVHETVVLNLETGLYHGLNPTAGRMLDALVEHSLVADAAAQLAAEFQMPLEDIQQDLCELCAGLVSRGLLVIQPDE